MTPFDTLATLSDSDLLAAVDAAARRERAATAELVALLVHVDSRRLYLAQGCSSLFTYCIQVLHLSEYAAYGRIEAARAARRFPVLLDELAEGTLTLTTVTLLTPHLTPDNHAAVLAEARHKSKREVEHLVARLRPQPDLPSAVRKLPCAPAVRPPAHPKSTASAPPLPDALPAASASLLNEPPPPSVQEPAGYRPTSVVTPLAPARYKMQITMTGETYETLRRLQDLLRHAIPDGDPAAIVDRALRVLLADVEKSRLAATERPRAARTVMSGSRHIPAAVRREVWARDGGHCTFVGATGRCTERGFLEFHHVEPYAVGGPPSVANLQLRCRAHNRHEAEVYFGRRLPLLVREAVAAYAGSPG